MHLGIVVRNMGLQSTRETVAACARAAEAAGLDDAWVVDHVAIPPDDAEGSGGRYLDPLTTLAFLAGVTSRIGLGTAVLILPYRPALPTAKTIATLQELSGGRLRLGAGVGWMEPEFRALGVPRARRGAIADETLAFLRRCFDGAGPDDVVEANGQPFLFRPRPKAPPIYVGGAPPHALARAVRFGDGWMPMAASPEKLRAPIAELQRLAAEAKRGPLEVVAMSRLPLEEPGRARDDLATLSQLGVTRFVHAERYDDASSFARSAERLAALR
ncbi:MAG TPA: TIGR03619 family F420-dependent LLM class oxidoreductase [Myxococcota bacterium]|nr:TIGR03619 family F420-dependent LLM class oxidoreductase [Myxococcota bacterium]